MKQSIGFEEEAAFSWAQHYLILQISISWNNIWNRKHISPHMQNRYFCSFIFWLGYCSHKSPLKCVTLSEPIFMLSALTVAWFSFKTDLGYCLNSFYVVLTMSRLLPSSTYKPLSNLLPGCAKHSCVYLDSPRVRKTNSCLPGISVNKKCCKKLYILSL